MKAAVDLRGQIDAAAYKDYIFPLVFFKRICDVRDEEYAGYEQEGGKEFADMMMQDSPIQIPMEAHWNVVFNTSENIGQALVDAFRQIELANPGKKIDGRIVGGLEGIFGDKAIWTNKNKMPDAIIRNLLNSLRDGHRLRIPDRQVCRRCRSYSAGVLHQSYGGGADGRDIAIKTS